MNTLNIYTEVMYRYGLAAHHADRSASEAQTYKAPADRTEAEQKTRQHEILKIIWSFKGECFVQIRDTIFPDGMPTHEQFLETIQKYKNIRIPKAVFVEDGKGGGSYVFKTPIPTPDTIVHPETT